MHQQHQIDYRRVERGIWQSLLKWVIKTPVWSRSSSG